MHTQIQLLILLTQNTKYLNFICCKVVGYAIGYVQFFFSIYLNIKYVFQF